MVTVKNVAASSPASKCGISPGDILVSINGKPINDVLDYGFYSTESRLEIVLLRGGKEINVSVKKGQYSELGAEFETYLIDKKKSCVNKCIFCFIDQNPAGMRESIYFKDDDERLSFLQGNYVSMTNLKETDISRIIEMHISPINISVHTTNAQLREKMLCNKNAGKVLKYLDVLDAHSIALNIQLVLCAGINDGAELEKTLEDLSRLESAESVAVVPAGLTKYRNGLYPLKSFDKNGAAAVIDTIDAFSHKYGRRFFASDEFYLISGRDIPDDEYYMDYPQIENGVGMLRNHKTEFIYALEELEESAAPREVTIATGAAAYDHICGLCRMLAEKRPNIKVNVERIENSFFGSNVTVSGLVTGGDIINTLRGKNLGEALLIPCNMLRYERDLFLDNVSVEALSKQLDIRVEVTEKDGSDLLNKIIGDK